MEALHQSWAAAHRAPYVSPSSLAASRTPQKRPPVEAAALHPHEQLQAGRVSSSSSAQPLSFSPRHPAPPVGSPHDGWARTVHQLLNPDMHLDFQKDLERWRRARGLPGPALAELDEAPTQSQHHRTTASTAAATRTTATSPPPTTTAFGAPPDSEATRRVMREEVSRLLHDETFTDARRALDVLSSVESLLKALPTASNAKPVAAGPASLPSAESSASPPPPPVGGNGPIRPVPRPAAAAEASICNNNASAAPRQPVTTTPPAASGTNSLALGSVADDADSAASRRPSCPSTPPPPQPQVRPPVGANPSTGDTASATGAVDETPKNTTTTTTTMTKAQIAAYHNWYDRYLQWHATVSRPDGHANKISPRRMTTDGLRPRHPSPAAIITTTSNRLPLPDPSAVADPQDTVASPDAFSEEAADSDHDGPWTRLARQRIKHQRHQVQRAASPTSVGKNSSYHQRGAGDVQLRTPETKRAHSKSRAPSGLTRWDAVSTSPTRSPFSPLRRWRSPRDVERTIREVAQEQFRHADLSSFSDPYVAPIQVVDRHSPSPPQERRQLRQESSFAAKRRKPPLPPAATGASRSSEASSKSARLERSGGGMKEGTVSLPTGAPSTQREASRSVDRVLLAAQSALHGLPPGGRTSSDEDDDGAATPQQPRRLVASRRGTLSTSFSTPPPTAARSVDSESRREPDGGSLRGSALKVRPQSAASQQHTAATTAASRPRNPNAAARPRTGTPLPRASWQSS